MPGYPSYQSAYSGAPSVGYGPAMNFDPGYDTTPVYGAYGATGPAGPFQGGGGFGVPGFGGSHTLPAYYAPMSAQYAPILPAPAANLVW